MSVSKINFGNVSVQNQTPTQKIVLPMPTTTTKSLLGSNPNEQTTTKTEKFIKTTPSEELSPNKESKMKDLLSNKKLIYGGIGILALGGLVYWKRGLFGLSKFSNKKNTQIKKQVTQSMEKGVSNLSEKIESKAEATIVKKEETINKSFTNPTIEKSENKTAQEVQKTNEIQTIKTNNKQSETKTTEQQLISKATPKYKTYDEQIAKLGITRESEANMRPIIEKHRKEANRILTENIHNRIVDIPTIEKAAGIRSASLTEPEPFHQAASWLEEAYKFAYSRAEQKDGKNIFNFIHNRITKENNSLAKMYAQMPIDEAKARLWRFVCETNLKRTHNGMTGEEFFLDIVNNAIQKTKIELTNKV